MHSASSAAPRGEGAPCRPGQVIGGRYRLVRQIGEGGMATVWEAEHLTLGSRVALKFLLVQRRGPAHRELVERFMREARTAAKIRHRNVVNISDFGLTDEELPYMVLELLEGETLASLLDRVGWLDPVEAARIASLLLRGLASVHDEGIVHRDLKPENVFLVEDPDGRFPKLLDFGVSRDSGGPTNLTREGFLIGTPDYMSPEQARGLRDLDRRTDIYSTGVILYEMISGRLPFEAENFGDLIVMITTQSPPPLLSLRPDCPPALAAIVETAMQRDRKLRYADGREMRRALFDAVEDAEGFGDSRSGLIAVRERAAPDPRELGVAVTLQGTEPGAGAAPPFEEPPGATDDTVPPHAAAPEASGPRPSPLRRAGWLLLQIAVLGVGVTGGVLLYERLDRVTEVEGTRVASSTPVSWEPASAGLPEGLAEPPGDPEVEVTIRLVSRPESHAVRIGGVPVDASEVQVPAGAEHVIEVVSPDDEVVWREVHPAGVDGAYLLWSDRDGKPRASSGNQRRPKKRARGRRGRRR